MGKTRLALECRERLRGLATPAVGRCSAGAQEATYAPLREVLTALADGDVPRWVRERLETEGGAQLAEQLAAAVGLAGGTAHTEDTALAARRLLAGLAQERPLLLVLEDIQWAAPAFLDLVELLVELAQRARTRALPRSPRPARGQAALGRRAPEQLGDPARRAERRPSRRRCSTGSART